MHVDRSSNAPLLCVRASVGFIWPRALKKGFNDPGRMYPSYKRIRETIMLTKVYYYQSHIPTVQTPTPAALHLHKLAITSTHSLEHSEASTNINERTFESK